MTITIPPYLESYFDDLTIIQKNSDGTQTEQEQMHVVDVGWLPILTGKIVACDGYMPSDYSFDSNFPIGEFLVQVGFLGDFSKNHGTVLCARIKFSDNKPVRWAPATYTDDEDNPDPSAPVVTKQSFSYSVDSGTGAFMDASACDDYDAFLLENENNWQVIDEVMNEQSTSWALWGQKNYKIAIFSSGYGDGLYPTYIGYDSNDKICRLVTDFSL